VNEEKSAESIEKYNRLLFNVNNFMVEQTETADYNQLVNTVVDQLDKLLRPIAITYNEYDEQNRTLRIKEIKANQGMLNIFLKISGKKFSSVATPVDAQLYEEIKAERVKIVPTLHEATGRAVPKTVSSAVSKAIGINCYLGLAYMVDGQLYGTSAIALKDAPDHSVMNLLKTYAYYTSMSIKRILAEEALRRSEQELKIVTDNMTDLIAMTGVEGKFTFLSENHIELFGYENEELLGRYAWEIIYAEDMAKMTDVFTKSILAGEGGRAEYRVVRKDGTLIWVDTAGSILYVNGEISGALFVNRDITDRKKAELDLVESENKFKTLFQDSLVSIIVFDKDTGEIVDANVRAWKSYGLNSLAELQTNDFWMEPPYSAKESLGWIRKSLNEGVQVFEWKNRKVTGEIFWEQVMLRPTIINGIERLISSATDITDRKQAEESLKESEERNRAILNALPDIMFIYSREGYYLDYHASDQSLLAVEPEHFIGKSVNEVLPQKVAEMFLQGFERVYETNQLQIINYTLDLPSGLKHFEARITLMDEQRLIVIIRDITDRKQAEEQIERLAQIADNAPSSILVHDYEGNLFYANEHTFHLYGYIKEEFMKLNLRDISAPESAELIRARMKEIEEKGEAVFEARNNRKDGSTVPMQVYVKQTEWFGKPALLSVSTDITERKKSEEALRVSEEKYKQIAENISDVVWMTDAELNTVYLSPSIEKMVGESVEDHMSKSLEERLPPDSLNKLLQIFQEEIEKEKDSLSDKNRSRFLEVQSYKADGSIIWVSMHISAIRDNNGNITGFQGTTRDVTDRKQAEEEIRYMSFHDQLTDLYNRHYFKSCEEELKDIPVLSVIMTDVNGLKLINDTYGHGAGDEMLKKYADLLRESFKQIDLIFRWGGDEFVVILKNTEEAKSWELCNRLKKHCGETFVKNIPLSISVGISSKLHGGDIDEAIKEAEDVMYKNKLTESKSSKNLIMKTLQQALAEKSFETKEHIDRITLIGRQFGERLGLSVSELSRLETLIMLHDIGKINIDSHILLKETALTDEEWVEIKKHPEVGYRITRTAEEFACIAEEILAHHERWDGKGYPQGLQGESTPYLARLLNLIDSYDVMSSGRPYKKKMSSEEIIEEIERCSGKQFDPELAKEFITCLKEGTISYQ